MVGTGGLSTPWIKKFLLFCARKYGAEEPEIADRIRTVQIIKFLTGPTNEDPNPTVYWTEVSDGDYYLPARISEGAVATFAEANGRRISESKTGLFLINKYKPTLTQVPMGSLCRLDKLRRMTLEIEEIELHASEGEPVIGRPTPVTEDVDVKRWIDGLLDPDPDKGNVLKREHEKLAADNNNAKTKGAFQDTEINEIAPRDVSKPDAFKPSIYTQRSSKEVKHMWKDAAKGLPVLWLRGVLVGSNTQGLERGCRGLNNATRHTVNNMPAENSRSPMQQDNVSRSSSLLLSSQASTKNSPKKEIRSCPDQLSGLTSSQAPSSQTISFTSPEKFYSDWEPSPERQGSSSQSTVTSEESGEGSHIPLPTPAQRPRTTPPSSPASAVQDDYRTKKMDLDEERISQSSSKHSAQSTTQSDEDIERTTSGSTEKPTIQHSFGLMPVGNSASTRSLSADSMRAVASNDNELSVGSQSTYHGEDLDRSSLLDSSTKPYGSSQLIPQEIKHTSPSQSLLLKHARSNSSTDGMTEELSNSVGGVPISVASSEGQISTPSTKPKGTFNKRELSIEDAVTVVEHKPSVWRTPSFQSNVHKRQKRMHGKSSIVFEDENTITSNGPQGQRAIPLKELKSLSKTCQESVKHMEDESNRLRGALRQPDCDGIPERLMSMLPGKELRRTRHLSLARQAGGFEDRLQTWTIWEQLVIGQKRLRQVAGQS